VEMMLALGKLLQELLHVRFAHAGDVRWGMEDVVR
jgi:hypothetical protein